MINIRNAMRLEVEVTLAFWDGSVLEDHVLDLFQDEGSVHTVVCHWE